MCWVEILGKWREVEDRGRWFGGKVFWCRLEVVCSELVVIYFFLRFWCRVVFYFGLVVVFLVSFSFIFRFDIVLGFVVVD